MELFEYAKAMEIKDLQVLKDNLIRNLDAIFYDDKEFKEKVKQEIINKY